MTHHPTATRRGTRMSFFAVAIFHVLGWGLLISSADWSGRGTAITVGTGALAYMLGLRHAFDADHIAAIDNSTRKLINSGRNPGSVGLFFSLGHSTVVFTVSALIALGLSALGTSMADANSLLRIIGGAIGTVVSGSFLILIAVLNAIVLVSLVKSTRGLTRGVAHNETDAQLEEQMQHGGVLTRVFGPVAKVIDRPWKMYPLGILFGLGFDTASSVAMLAIAGGTAFSGANPFAIVALPLVFMSGMALGDTVDGYLMQKAYGWAAGRNDRRLKYNIVVTSVSVLAAVAIGLPILVTFVADTLGLKGGAWDFVRSLDFEYVGFALLGLFLILWGVGWTLWRVRSRKLIDLK